MNQDIPSYIQELRKKVLGTEFVEKDLQLIDNLELSYNFIYSKILSDLKRIDGYYENRNGG